MGLCYGYPWLIVGVYGWMLVVAGGVESGDNSHGSVRHQGPVRTVQTQVVPGRADLECSANCSVKPGLPCTLQTAPQVPECPFQPIASLDKTAGPPDDFRVSLSRRMENGAEYMDVTTSFSMPKDGSFQNVEGFTVLETTVPVEKSENFHQPVCRYFNLSEAQWTDDNKQTSFQESCSSFNGPAHFLVTVRSTPRVVSDYRSRQAIVSVRDFYNGPLSDADSLIMQIVVYNESCSQTVRVSFLQAPNVFNFQKYMVRVIPAGQRYCKEPCIYSNVNHDKAQNMAEAVFRDVPLGKKYYVQIQPENTWVDNKCTCQPKCSGGSFCIATNSAKFNMFADDPSCVAPTTVAPSTPSSTAPPTLGPIVTERALEQPESTLKLLWPIVGGTVGLFLLILTAALLVHFCRTKTPVSGSAPPVENSGEQQRTVENPPDDKKCVQLLYSLDHPEQDQVVKKFIAFLEEACNCRVETENSRARVPKQDLQQWVSDTVVGKDPVIVIESASTFEKASAVLEGNSEYSHDAFTKACRVLKECRENVEDRYEKFQERVLVVRFSFTQPLQQPLPFVSTSEKGVFIFPGDLLEFVVQLTERNFNDVVNYTHYTSSIELKEAIADIDERYRNNAYMAANLPVDPIANASDSETLPLDSSLQRLLRTVDSSRGIHPNPTTGTPSTHPISFQRNPYQGQVQAQVHHNPSCAIHQPFNSFGSHSHSQLSGPRLPRSVSRERLYPGRHQNFPSAAAAAAADESGSEPFSVSDSNGIVAPYISRNHVQAWLPRNRPGANSHSDTLTMNSVPFSVPSTFQPEVPVDFDRDSRVDTNSDLVNLVHSLNDDSDNFAAAMSHSC